MSTNDACLINSVFLKAVVCVCVCTCLCRCACVYTRMCQGQRSTLNFFLYISSSCFWCGVSHSAWSSLIWLACVTSKRAPGIPLPLHIQRGAHRQTSPQLAYTGTCETSMLPSEASPQPLVWYNFREKLLCVPGHAEHRVTKQNISANMEQKTGDVNHMFPLRKGWENK